MGNPWPRQTFLPQVMTWSRVGERHVASRRKTITQSAIDGTSEMVIRMRVAGIKWMGQAQAALYTGLPSTAAPRATSGLPGFSAVATEPRGHLAVDGPGASNNYSAFSRAPLAPASVRWGPTAPNRLQNTCGADSA